MYVCCTILRFNFVTGGRFPTSYARDRSRLNSHLRGCSIVARPTQSLYVVPSATAVESILRHSKNFSIFIGQSRVLYYR